MKFKIGSFFKTSFINIHRSNKISDSRGTGTNNRRYIVLFITSSKYVCKKRNDVIKLKNIECYPPPLPRICIYFFFIINFVLGFFFSHRNLFDRWRKGQTSRVWVTVPWGLCETQRKQATNVCKQTHLSHLRKVGFSLKFCLNLGIILSSVFSKFVYFYVDFYKNVRKYTIFLRNNF